MHVMKRDRMLKIFHLLRESVGQSCEPAHRHTHCEVLPLNVACGDVLVIGRTTNDCLTCPHADCGAVASVWRVALAVNLLQHRIINVLAEGIPNRVQINAVTVGRKLDAVRQTLSQVLNKVMRCSPVTAANEPAMNELCVGINRDPCPSVPCRSIHSLLKRAVFVLGVNERPNLVALDSLAGKIAKNFVLVLRTGAAKIAK